MKTKFVYILDDDLYTPNNIQSCYIFDNEYDALNFYDGNGWMLEVLSTNKWSSNSFRITNKVSGSSFDGKIIKGNYV
jgi:hypothetical protein